MNLSRSEKGVSAVVLVIAVSLAIIGAFLLGGRFFAPKKEALPELPPPFPAVSIKPPRITGDNPLKNHNTYFTISSDGKTWQPGNLIRKGASVPDVVFLEKDLGKFKKGDLLVYFVDAITMIGPGTENLGITYSSDLGKTWQDSGVIKLSGKLNKGAAVDPSLLQLADGSLRLYFFGPDMTEGDPAKVPGKHKIYSAKSADGINFTVEPGTRFEEEKLTDPEVIIFQDKYLMYYSVGATSKLATSTDGLSFAQVSITGGELGGVPGAITTDSGVRLFACGRGLGEAISSNGVNFSLEQQDIFKGEIKATVCDPAVVKLTDGRYLMVYKVDEGRGQRDNFPPPKPNPNTKPN